MLFVGVILVWLNLFATQPETVEREVELPPVYFRWDKSSHDASYARNRIAVNSILDMIKLIGPEKIKYAELVAYASPEGNREHNLKLSRARAYEIRWLVRQKAPGIASKIRIRAGGEGWVLLRARIQADKRISEQSRERILRILDDTRISDDTRKWRLANRLGSDPRVGDLWQYLLKTHYPKLRACTVTLRFKAQPGTPLASIGHAVGEEKSTEIEPSGADKPVEETKPVEEAPVVEEVPAEPEKVQTEQAAPAEEGSAQPAAAEAEASEAAAAEQATAAEPAAAESSAASRKRSDRIPVVAVSTNLIYDLTYIPGYGPTSIPSFSLEYYPAAGHWTAGADVEWPMWQHFDTHRFMQINNITLWGRRYFQPKDESFKGLYLLGSMGANRYGVGWNEKGWIGEGIHGSIGLGWKTYLGSSRFFFDTGIALGVFWSRYDPYVYSGEATGWYYYDYTGKPADFTKRSKRLLWFGPTRAYVSIGYDLFTRRRK